MTSKTPALSAQLRRLLAAQVPSDFADWLDFVAIGALLAFAWQAEARVFAFLAVALGAPYLFVGPFAGALVDRADARKVMALANLGRAVVTVSFVFAPNWPVLLALVALRSTVDSFYSPAKQTALQAYTAEGGRARANAVSYGINQASKIAAPAIGGTWLIWWEPQAVFLANAGVSVLAALMVLRLAPLPPVQAAEGEAAPGMLASVREGLAEIGGSPVLRATLGMMAAGYFAMFFYDTLIPPLTRDLGLSETDLGLAMAFVGAGGVIGALGLGGLAERVRPFVLIATGSLISASVVGGFGWAEMVGQSLPKPLFLAGFAVLGLTSALMLVPYRTVIQSATRPEAMGRVSALNEALNTSALLVAPFIGAAIAEATRIGGAFVAGALIMALIALRAATLRQVGAEAKSEA